MRFLILNFHPAKHGYAFYYKNLFLRIRQEGVYSQSYCPILQKEAGPKFQPSSAGVP